ncbi:SLC13 family permease [Acidimicrobiia bacterium EGI L10123]|uniref:SLC13 family permease n=1 Tax=Salinilacustrithrix flava TaxID=2957203 RepID=UPI003D7C2B5B|nr:SLC13 family permease [Acidimicrobiia bacterium EGI L10123]
MVLVLAILAGTVILFVTEVVRIDVAAIGVMVLIGLTDLVPPGEVFAGFSSNAVISIIAVMILGAGLDRVGVMRSVAAWLLRVGGETERRVLVSVSATVGVISAFLQNIGAAALFLPVVERVAERTGIAVSRLLMPMGFAAILGGTLTLVASGPLILLNDLLASSADSIGEDITPYGLFAPTPIGLAILTSGIALFALAGRWLLPAVPADRGSGAALPDVESIYGLDRDVRPARVPAGSTLLDDTVGTIEAGSGQVRIVAVSDHEGVALGPSRDERLVADTTVGLVGPDPAVERFVEEHGLQPIDDNPFAVLHDDSWAGLAEVVVRPGSEAVGRRVEDLRLRHHHGVVLLALHHRGEVITEGLRNQQLAAGDVMIVFAPWERLASLDEGTSFVVLTEHPLEQPRTAKRWWALGALATALGLVIVGDLQLSLALMTGAVAVLVSGVLTPDEAYRAVSWKTVFLLAALIPLGQAVETTGTAAWIADKVIGAAGDLPAWGVQLTIALLATVFTLVVSNVGATVLLVPLAANVAVGVGADPAQFGLIVALAASNAFLLPTHQVNALLMGPGGYRVPDYLRAGAAMSVLFLMVLIPAVNLFA